MVLLPTRQLSIKDKMLQNFTTAHWMAINNNQNPYHIVGYWCLDTLSMLALCKAGHNNWGHSKDHWSLKICNVWKEWSMKPVQYMLGTTRCTGDAAPCPSYPEESLPCLTKTFLDLINEFIKFSFLYNHKKKLASYNGMSLSSNDSFSFQTIT